MKIIGVGIGPGMLTAEAIEAIRKAEMVYGSTRAIELAADHICCEPRTIEDYTRIHELPDNAVVLSTGDPNLSGLGKYAGPDDVIIPGISSLQAACARLKVGQEDVVVISAHGRNPTMAVIKFRQAITSGSTVFLLPSEEFGVDQVSVILKSIELDVPIAVLERLGYPDEHVAVGTAERLPAVNSRLHCIMVGPAVKLDEG